MSYDLFFEARSGKRIDGEQFTAHFRGRRYYEQEKGQFFYQNENTGIYFIFDEPDEGVVAFNLNLFRPHVFGLEAAPELEAFARALDLQVIDPQGDSEGPAPFDARLFVRRWNDSNRFGYRAMLKDNDHTDPIHTWPGSIIHQIWEWNYAIPSDSVAEDVFIPRIMAVEVDHGVISVVVWPPACPILLPAVDAVLVPLAQSGKGSEAVALVRSEELFAAVNSHQVQARGLPRYRLTLDGGEQWPPHIAAFLNAKRNPGPKLNGVSFDQILDQELVDEVMRG